MNRTIAYKTSRTNIAGSNRSDSVLIMPAVSDKADSETSFLAALAESARSHGLKVGILTPPDSRKGSVNMLARIRQVVRMIPHFGGVHIIAGGPRSFWSWVVPVILIAKFFSKRILLTFETAVPEDFFARYSKIAFPFLRLVDALHVQTAWSGGVFLKHALDVTVLSFPVDVIGAKYSTVRKIQPRIICDRPLIDGNNILCLLKAFAFVKQKYPRAELILSGNGSKRSSLEKYLNDAGIHGVELQSGLGAWDGADLYVNPSTIDTLPTSITRAFALGIPVVTTDAGAITEIVHDRVNGMVLAVNDHVGMAERIIELVEDDSLVAQLSSHARADIEALSVEKLGRSWDDFYRQR